MSVAEYATLHQNRMRRKLGISYSAIAMFGMLPLQGWQNPAPPNLFTLDKIADRLYVLSSKSAGDAALGNVAFYVSDEGVLVVDDQFERQRRDGETVEIAQGVRDQIRKVTDQPIRYVINTHHHADHAGGNLTFGKLATIVAHQNERKNLIATHDALLSRLPTQIERTLTDLSAARSANDGAKSGQLQEQLAAQRLQLELAQSADFQKTLPSLTYASELSIHLGGEEIRLYHFGPAHTDGDTLVYFTKANAAHWGDVFETKSHPFIDRSAGSSTRGWLEFLERGLEAVGPTAKMIPGHGYVATADDVKAVHQYFVDLRGAVGREITAGKTRDETMASVPPQFPRYKDFRPGEARFRMSVGSIYDEMKEEAGRAR
jgi:glyoxylase-like metal-dependent hydrolase (beta-lactamase superfamily II)